MFSIESQKNPGPKTDFSCPSCQRPVSGNCYENVETVKVLSIIPIFKWRNVYVECHQCHMSYPVGASMDNLFRMNPHEVTQQLSLTPSSGGQLCAILSILTLITGFGGVFFGGIGIVLNRKTKGWPFFLSIFGLIAGIIWTAISISNGP